MNLLDVTSDDNATRFNTKKWVVVDDQSGKIYNTNKQIRFKTSVLQSWLCYYRDVYVVFKGTITVQTKDNRAIDWYNRDLILKNSALFTKGISKVNNVLIDTAEDLDIVMPMYSLIEYSKNYSKTFGTLWSYYKDISTHPITNSESFKHKTNIEFSFPLKHLHNFWRTLDTLLISFEVSLTLT